MPSAAVQVNVRLAPDDVALVDQMAAARGVTRSAVVKLALQRVLAAERAKHADA